MTDNQEVVDVCWFAQMGRTEPIGFVICKDKITKQMKGYIGVCKGHDEGRDIKRIIETGAKVTVNTLKNLLAQMESRTKEGKNAEN